MLVSGVVHVELLGRVIVLGPLIDGERRGDELCFSLGELDEEDGADGARGLCEPGDGVGEDGFVGFSEAAFEHEGGVFGVDDVDAGVGFFGGEWHCW